MSQETASYLQSPSSREKLSQKFPQFCRKRLNRAWTICDVIGSFSGRPRRMCCNRSVVISWPSRGCCRNFLEAQLLSESRLPITLASSLSPLNVPKTGFLWSIPPDLARLTPSDRYPELDNNNFSPCLGTFDPKLPQIQF